MKIHPLHSWSLAPGQATTLQSELAERTITDVPVESCKLVAGADISYDIGSTTFYAGVVVLRAGDLQIVERRGVRGESPFPYVPGLLSFREAPLLLEAFARVESQPDVVLFDGQGIAHQRHLGLAAHVGLWLQVPSVGCAKTRLVGQYEEPEREAGSTSPLRYHGAVVGSVVRTKTGINPLFVSPGHLIDLPSAVRWTLATCRGYRLPEPTRQAHLYVNELRRGAAPLE